MRRTETVVFVSAVAVSLLIGVSSLLPHSIYSSAAWHILWIAVAGALVFAMFKGRLWRNVPAIILHISFLCMIAGGFCTSFLSRRGTLHLYPSQTLDRFVTPSGKSERLPEAVTLLSFSPEYYPGMNFPKDFKSVLKTASGDTIRISMNHIGHLDNYRLYQASYDQTGGTVLTVTYDPYGIAVTYTGFLLFAIGGILWLLRRVLRARKAKRLTAVGALLFILAAGSENASAVPAVTPALADSLASRQVLFNGEPVSFTSFSTRLTYKLTGRATVSGLTPEAFVASLIKYKDDWSRVPFIKIKSKALREALGVEGNYAAVADFYDENGDYLPENLYKGGDGPLDKDILSTDERIALLIDLWNGDLFSPLGSESDLRRSDLSMKSEILYYHVNPPKWLLIGSALVLFLIILSSILKRNFRIPGVISVLGIAGIAAYGWLWYVKGGIPLSDTADMMEFLGVCMILLTASAAWRRESELLLGLGMAAASFLLLVALLGMKDPVLSPVMPVLASPWLSVHVSLVMLAYAVLGFTLPVSISALLLPSQRDRMTRLSLSLLGPGVFLLGLGIITGAMWANVSWGRYWAWDPKETWSLVTLLLYSIPLHRYFKMRRQHAFCSLYLILSFGAILMTYFGVNLLPSLHAYN